jgi:hypothetical protein
MIIRHGAGGDLDDRRSTRNQTQEESHRIRGEDRPRRQGMPPRRAGIAGRCITIRCPPEHQLTRAWLSHARRSWVKCADTALFARQRKRETR